METTNISTVVNGFFKKPEGKTGIAFMVLIGGGLLFAFYKILPWLITLAQNTLYLALLVIGLVALVAIVSSKEFRISVWAFYQVMMKALTGLIVELDPIAIIKGYIKKVKGFRETAGEKIGLLNGQIQKLSMRIDSNRSAIEDSLKRAKVVKESEKWDADLRLMKVAVEARKAARKKDSNVRLYDMLVKMQKMYKALTKLHDVSGIVVEDLEDQATNMIQEWEAAKAAGSALRSIKKAMQGTADDRFIFEMSFEKMQNDVSKQLGEFQTFLDFSTDIIDNVDIENALFAEEGLKMLDEFEEKGFATMMKTFEDAAIAKASSNPDETAFTSLKGKQHLVPLERNFRPSLGEPKYKIL
jgi:hypothetical protein